MCWLLFWIVSGLLDHFLVVFRRFDSDTGVPNGLWDLGGGNFVILVEVAAADWQSDCMHCLLAFPGACHEHAAKVQ